MQSISTHNRRDRIVRTLAVVAIALATLAAALRLVPAAAAAEPIQVTEPLSFTVDPELRPQVDSVPIDDQGGRAPVATLADGFGNAGDFAADELVVATADRAELDGVLARWHGELLRSLDPGRAELDGVSPSYLVRIDPGLADPGALVEDVGRLLPDAHGAQRVSSDAGLGVLAAAASESVRGLDVGVNWISYGATVRTRSTQEAPGSGNPFGWPYLCKGCVQSTNVAEAWNVLARAGRNPLTSSPVPLAIIDSGFTNGYPDWPAVIAQKTSGPNPTPCGGSPCPWHGNAVTETALALTDDRFGTAGVAGRVAAPIIEPAGNMFTIATSLVDARLAGARIANMSFSGTIPFAGTAFTNWFDTLVRGVRMSGMVLFAAAGNDGKNVDVVNCFFSACWEAEYFWPCETPGVLCVGALGANSRGEAGFSNFGTGGLRPADSVDLWAPGSLINVGLDPSDPAFATNPNGFKTVSGTSFSSPFAAGVAALILAANPALPGGTVESILLGTAQVAAITPAKANGTGDVFPDAEKAVITALGGNAPPDIRIVAPANGGSYPRGLVHAVANASDDQGPPTVVWFIDNVAVAVGSTVDLDTYQLGFGQHTISAQARDGTWIVGDADGGVTITLTNTAPQVAITTPLNGQTLSFSPWSSMIGKDTICFAGTSSDVNNSPATLQDNQVEWHVNGHVLSGHKVSATASQLGLVSGTTYQVDFRGHDDGGLPASATVWITIVPFQPTISTGGLGFTVAGC